MNRQIIRLLSNFFIVSSYGNYTVSPSQMVQFANNAFFEHDYKSLTVVAHELMELSPRTEDAGRYFKALAIGQDGATGREEARRIFEELTDQPNPILRSLALGGLAIEASYHQESPTSLSQRLLTQASRLAYHSGAYMPFLQSQHELSLFHSLNGDHKTAFELLQGVAKLTDSVKGVYPAHYFNYLNSVAYELAATGQPETALQCIKKVVASPYAARFPEWHETKREIEEKLRQPSRSQIVVPEATAQAYKYCFENVYRLSAFYEFQPSQVHDNSEVEKQPGNQSDKHTDNRIEDDTNIHRFPSREVLAAPRHAGEGVFEVRLFHQGRRDSLYVIPELTAAQYTDWFAQLDEIAPAPDSPFILEIVFNNGAREFLFTSKPVTEQAIRNLKLLPPQSATANPSATEILQAARQLLLLLEKAFPTWSAN